MTQGRFFRLNVISPFLSIAALLVLHASALAQSWQHIGVGGGGYFSNVVIDPDDEDIIYVGSDVTGLFRTTDGGTTWDALTDGLGSYYVGEILLAQPINQNGPKTIFVSTTNAGTGENSDGGGVYRSTDGGESFEKVLDAADPNGGDKAFFALAVDAASILYAGEGFFRYETPTTYGTAKMWRSTDFGTSWQAFSTAQWPFTNCAIHSILPVDNDPHHAGTDVLYVSASGSLTSGVQGVGVRKGVWNGSDWTWSDINGSNGGGGTGLPHHHTRDLEATYSQGALSRLYVVLDTRWDEGTPEEPGDPETVYQREDGFGGGVWYTTNGGATWNPTSVVCDGFLSTNPPRRMRNLAIDAQQRIYVALNDGNLSQLGVWRGTEGNPSCQGTWGHWDHLSQAYVDPVTDWDGQLHQYFNVELTYYPQIGGSEGLDVHPSTGDIVFAASFHVLRCPGGDCLPGPYQDPDWEALDTTHIFGIAGDYWTTTVMDDTQAFEISVDPENSYNWYLGLGDVGLFRSTNGGGSWKPCRARDPYDEYENKWNCWKIFAANVDTDTQWFGVFGEYAEFPGGTMEGFNVWVWTDAGPPEDSNDPDDPWEIIEFPDPDAVHIIYDVLVVDTKMVVSTDKGIYRSEFIDDQWGELDEWMNGLGGQDPPVSTIASEVVTSPSGSRFIAALQRDDDGNNGGIYYSTNFGANWQPANHSGGNADCWKSIYSLEWSKDNTSVVYAGSGNPRGCFLKSTNQGTNWTFNNDDFGGYDPSHLSIVDVVETTTEVPALYVAFRPVKYSESLESTFGGVWKWSDLAGWMSFNGDLDAGHMAFLKEDETSPGRLFAGTLGNGAFIYEEESEEESRGTNPPLTTRAKVERAQPALHDVRFAASSASANASVRFSLAAEGPVTVSIYDPAGRLVRLLQKEQVLAQGAHIATWDGIDGSGKRAPSGVYFARVATPVNSETVKIVMVR